jgi:hypothetical protein
VPARTLSTVSADADWLLHGLLLRRAWVTAHTATQSGMQAATLWSARWPTPSCRSAVPGSPSAVLAPLARDGVACVCVCVRVWGGAQAIEEEGIEANVRARGEQLTAGLHDLAARYAPLYPWQHACALTVLFLLVVPHRVSPHTRDAEGDGCVCAGGGGVRGEGGTTVHH